MNTLIIAGGCFEEEFLKKYISSHSYDSVIAVDGGLSYALKLDIVPDYIVGDFDTYGDSELEYWENRGTKILRFNPEKDDTDSEIAIRIAAENNSNMDIICGTGGRIDHLLANIHNLKLAADLGVSARIVDSQNIIFLAFSDFSMRREDYPGKYVSFVPFAGEVTGLKLKGLKYTLDGYTLKPGVSRCVSNEFDSDVAYVSFDTGSLIVINSSDIESE